MKFMQIPTPALQQHGLLSIIYQVVNLQMKKHIRILLFYILIMVLQIHTNKQTYGQLTKEVEQEVIMLLEDLILKKMALYYKQLKIIIGDIIQDLLKILDFNKIQFQLNYVRSDHQNIEIINILIGMAQKQIKIKQEYLSINGMAINTFINTLKHKQNH